MDCLWSKTSRSTIPVRLLSCSLVLITSVFRNLNEWQKDSNYIVMNQHVTSVFSGQFDFNARFGQTFWSSTQTAVRLSIQRAQIPQNLSRAPMTKPSNNHRYQCKSMVQWWRSTITSWPGPWYVTVMPPKSRYFENVTRHGFSSEASCFAYNTVHVR